MKSEMILEIEELPTANFTILCLAALLCVVLAVVCYLAYNKDEEEISSVKDIIYFQENIPLKDPVYILTLRIESCYAYAGWTDLIVRLRGTRKDSPLILFRDYDGRYMAGEKILNIGFSLPFDLGSIVEIDIAGDNSEFDEGYSVFTFSDLFIRKLPRKAETLANSKTRMMLQSGDSPFDALSKNVRTWASVETLTNAPGVDVLGISVPDTGKIHTVRARDSAVCLHLQEEVETLKKKAEIGFRPQHYIWSQSPPWHEPWSEYSHLDQEIVIFLDIIATLVAVSSCYAYGVERLLGANLIAEMILPMMENVQAPATSVQEFDLMDMFSHFTKYLIPLVLVVYVGLVASTFVIPLSLLWYRLFRLIGGKGFENALEDAQPPPPISTGKSEGFLQHPTPRARHSKSLRSNTESNKAPRPSTRHHDDDHWFDDDLFGSNCLMLRTLECKSTHTASCVTSSRRLRMEPLITNCSADHITARSVAYIRTKMTKLRDDTILSGLAGLKHPDVLHESHTESTDAPQMPPPSSAPDGSGDVVRISRYCERLVQQAVRHIHDNSVIAECFEVAPHVDAGGVPGKKTDKFANCCPKRCCGMKGNPDESISNLTFFTEEDAISLQEMCDHLPTPKPSEQKFTKISPRPPAGVARSSRVKLKNISKKQVSTGAPSFPSPSAKPRKSSLKKFSLKNLKESMNKKAYENRDESETKRKTRERIRKTGLRVLPPTIERSTGSDKGEKRCEKPTKKKKGVRFKFERGEKRSNLRDQLRAEEKGSKDMVEKEKNTSRKVLKKFRERTRGSPSSTPFPSARSDVFYDPVADSTQNYDWRSAKSHISEPPEKESLPQSAPFKGNMVKLCVFGFLLALQLGEIFFVTAFEMKENKFFLRNVDDSPGPGASRMSCALLSSILAVFWYPLFTVHVIALLSYLVESIRLQMSHEDEPYEDAGSMSSRHSLEALP